jgi:hypothetical protein
MAPERLANILKETFLSKRTTYTFGSYPREAMSCISVGIPGIIPTPSPDPMREVDPIAAADVPDSTSGIIPGPDTTVTLKVADN